MNPITPDLFSHDGLAVLLASYGLRAEDIQFLRHSQNHVYACRLHDRKVILRISEGRHRRKEHIEAELAWMHLLISNGIRACKPIPTKNGEACVELEVDGRACIAACFEHVPGSPITPQDLQADLYEKLGGLLGQMHSLTTCSSNAHIAASRPHWHESRLLREDREQLGERLSPAFCASVDDLIQQLRKPSATPDTYGLVHGDFSLGNCHLDGSDLWLFDFDNCEQGYFTQELATVLYDSIYCKVLNKFADAGLNERVAAFWKPFWRGYGQTGPGRALDLAQLQRFFLLREAIIYIHYHRVLDLRKVDASFHAGLEVMRTNVENQVHQVDFAMILPSFEPL